MKIKTLLLLCILSFALTPSLNAQGLIIKMQDGTESQMLITSVRKLSFSSDQLVMTPKSGTPDYYNLDEIQKLYFGVMTSAGENMLAGSGNLLVYPNPTEKEITLINLPESTDLVRIYGMDGRLVQQNTLTSGELTIDISKLQSGIYFLVADGQTTKFIKL
jgi:hypothetical protein